MTKNRLQALVLQTIYRGWMRWFLQIFVGVQFPDTKFLKSEKQFIIVANHNSHLDTLSLLSSLPSNHHWRVKAVAAEDYFGKTRLQAKFSNFFLNTLLISRKADKDPAKSPIAKMLKAIDDGYSLILFPEGTRGKPEQMDKIKSGIAHILMQRPDIKYIPVLMTGMGKSLPKGKFVILPYNATIHYGTPTKINTAEKTSILEQIRLDFEKMIVLYQTKTEDS